MADQPKTNSNWRQTQTFVVTASFTLKLPPNVGKILLLPAAALTGTNVIYLPYDTRPGDSVAIVSQYGITGLTISPRTETTDTILAGPAAVTALTAGTPVRYTKHGNGWLRTL